MAAFMQRLSRFARSPQGKRAISQAQRLAKDPKTRRQLDDVRRRLAGRGRKPGR
jgi:hypothetical protein